MIALFTKCGRGWLLEAPVTQRASLSFAARNGMVEQRAGGRNETSVLASRPERRQCGC
jgi:hypothetical protein